VTGLVWLGLWALFWINLVGCGQVRLAMVNCVLVNKSVQRSNFSYLVFGLSACSLLHIHSFNLEGVRLWSSRLDALCSSNLKSTAASSIFNFLVRGDFGLNNGKVVNPYFETNRSIPSMCF